MNGNYIKHIWLLALVFWCMGYNSLNAYSQDNGSVEVKGIVKYGYNTLTANPVDGAIVQLYENQTKLKSITTGSSGRYAFTLDLDKNYFITFTKEGLITKKIQVITKVPSSRSKGKWTSICNIRLFDYYQGIDVSALQQPVTKIRFFDDNFGGMFTYDKEYSKIMDRKVASIEKLAKEKHDKLESLTDEDIKHLVEKKGITPELPKYDTAEAKRIEERLDTLIQNAEIKKDSIITDAEQRANRIREKAKEDAEIITQKILDDTKHIDNDGEDLTKARLRAKEIIRRAEQKAKEIIEAANNEAADILAKAADVELNIASKLPKEPPKPFSQFGNLSKETKYQIENIEELEFTEEELGQIEDSLLFLEKEISVRKKELKRARFLLELEKLRAKTREDSIRIAEREKLIERAERDLLLAEKEIAKIKKQIQLQYYKIRQQRILLIIGIVAGILLIAFLIYLYSNYRKKQKINALLDSQNKEIMEQNKKIQDSLLYAKRIQTAILPPDKVVNSTFSNNFVLFRPKDIVSGDFYWLQDIDDRIYFSVVDCTGHGVPGAFMSIIGYNSLNKILKELNVREPNEILDHLNELVNETLRTEGKFGDVNDGMDLALCSINKNCSEIEFAGAYNPLYIVRKKGVELFQDDKAMKPTLESNDFCLYEIKATKQPIGGSFRRRKKYKLHKIKLQENDRLYVFSDGYLDQFGGVNDREKMKANRFREILMAIQDKPMHIQRNILDDKLEEWRGEVEQMDDICILGININANAKNDA